MSEVIEAKIREAMVRYGVTRVTWDAFLVRYPDYASVTPDSFRSQRAMYQWLRLIHGPWSTPATTEQKAAAGKGGAVE